MAKRKPKQPGHRHSGEMLREVVAAVVPDNERELYLPFARELYTTLHRPPIPDFSRRTKLVVMKHFRRGLSGRKLALIGQQMLSRLFPPAGNAVRAN